MKACGLIVEYNPYHNGHQYHLEQSKQITAADCTIAVMSGNFLQRGEPAIIDKFSRAKIAIEQGVDLVVELPFVYAVQNSDLFSRGAVLTLGALNASTLCFGSEHGEIHTFIEAFDLYQNNQEEYTRVLKDNLSTGLSFPEASKYAYASIGLTTGNVDLSQPNNILGFSYVKSIFSTNQSIKPITIKRHKNSFHQQDITHPIASATSIRKELLASDQISKLAESTLPETTKKELTNYYKHTGIWHHWEQYFSILQYRVLTMTDKELGNIHGVEEGLENRLKRTASKVTSFVSWMEQLKTKRYTWTRLQRVFVHILTNTTKETIKHLSQNTHLPYIRLLGMSEQGQAYLKEIKSKRETPIITGFKKNFHPMLDADERATDAFYSVLEPGQRIRLRKQEFEPPIIHF
ncbi:nucleotidyltransferase [Aquibacillus rhizosphaerae]|uniref:tRNA(Met) cytidine acetate ligase n=1 Tax=Aquibacillus rhizosphaerae TaxID=3051431 RepID=A0ABT7L7A8_9BACI|nr:nucleotidyltransferase [Aquibacillus sp. LR5S19]MDL4841279.1 nucleotidyltransferase [Aquibacillus sp. LR5S19]